MQRGAPDGMGDMERPPRADCGEGRRSFGSAPPGQAILLEVGGEGAGLGGTFREEGATAAPMRDGFSSSSSAAASGPCQVLIRLALMPPSWARCQSDGVDPTSGIFFLGGGHANAAPPRGIGGATAEQNAAGEWMWGCG